MKAANTLEGGVVAPKIIGAPPLRVSAMQRVGLADLGASTYQVSSNAKGAPCRNERQGALQSDAGAGVKLTGVVMPQKRSKAARSQDNQRKKRADNGLDDKVESTPPVGERTQRLTKKAESKGWALPAMEMGHTAVGMGAKAKEIKEIDSEESDDEGAQAQAGAKCAGKTEKSPKTKRRALTPKKKDRQMVKTEAKADDGVGGNWEDSNVKSLGGRANNKSLAGYDTPPLSLRWGMEELQQRVWCTPMWVKMLPHITPP
jgi:hypothetical protein